MPECGATVASCVRGEYRTACIISSSSHLDLTNAYPFNSRARYVNISREQLWGYVIKKAGMHCNCFKLCLEWIQTSRNKIHQTSRVFFFITVIYVQYIHPIYLINYSNYWDVDSCVCVFFLNTLRSNMNSLVRSTSCSEFILPIDCRSCFAFRHSLSNIPPYDFLSKDGIWEILWVGYDYG